MTVLGEHLEKASVPLPEGKSPNETRDPTLRGSRRSQPFARNYRRISLLLSMTHLFAGFG